MTQAIGWLREIEDSVALARKSVGGPSQYLGMFPGAEPGVRDPHLAEYLSAGKTLQKNRSEGFQAIEALAHRGSPLSMLFLADAIRKGDHYRIDLDNSESWYQHAAALGSGRAMYGLGLVHLQRGDVGTAIDAFKSAGDRGCGAALWALGLLYRRGGGDITPDSDAARAFFERGAALGHVWSSRSLSLLLMTGRYGLWHRLGGYARYVAGFVAAPLMVISNRVDPVIR